MNLIVIMLVLALTRGYRLLEPKVARLGSKCVNGPKSRSRWLTLGAVGSDVPKSVDNPDGYNYHLPVMLEECLDYLKIRSGGIYLDCTLGGGGHSKAILERGGSVIGLDQDSDAIAQASQVCKEYLDEGRMEIFQTNFRNAVPTVMERSKLAAGRREGLVGVDGVLMDLGISSHQIDEASRGFAFGAEGPLDMRMAGGGSTSSLTAATIVNEWDTESLANVLYEYGDETRSRQISREIVSTRPHTTTLDVKKAICKVTSFKRQSATLARCFQALRIVVNDEMGALDDALNSIHGCVVPGGRLVVMSYHSLEDKRVKRLMRHGSVHDRRAGELELDVAQMAYDLHGATRKSGPWTPLFRRAQGPSETEIGRNRRSRSAKLRVACRDEDESAEEGSPDLSSHRREKSRNGFVGKKQAARLRRQQEEPSP
jgi:16S rRNA (cytosine1402-N4)-methyltransferase